MSKRRRDSVKAQSRKRLQKTEEVPSPLVANKRSTDKRSTNKRSTNKRSTNKRSTNKRSTPETKHKAKDEEIAPKIRIGPNLILTGPNRSGIDVEETDRRSVTPEIMYGHSDAEHKREDPLFRKTRQKNSEGHVRVYGRQQNGQEVIDNAMVSPVKGWMNKWATSEVPPSTMVGQLRQMEEKLRRAERRISQLEGALDEKSKELDAAASFMKVIEPLSGADIISLADTFNDEVFQGAAYIAESLGPSKHRHRGHQKRTAQYKDEYKQALMSLGADLLWDLMQEGEDHSGGFFLLQVALQVCMVTFGVNVLQSWSPDSDENKVTDQIYRRILGKEIQGVAGSWRSVTRRSQGSGTTHRKEKTDALLYTIIDILTVAGCWGREDDSSAFLTRFRGNIVRIVNSTLKLRDAIGSVTHIDILPMTVPPESHFCPEVMTDCYASNTGATVSDSDKVLATTALGLEQKVNSLEGDTRRAVLLKPKVVLRSALLSFLQSERQNC